MDPIGLSRLDTAPSHGENIENPACYLVGRMSTTMLQNVDLVSIITDYHSVEARRNSRRAPASGDEFHGSGSSI